MNIDPLVHRKRKNLIASLADDRLPWWGHWRDCADYILPKRYNWLLSDNERRNRMSKNSNIIDGTGTQAARTLASGMMNGITSPSRPWFKLRLAGFELDDDSEARIWLDEVERRMMLVMAESNFYNCLAVMYLDLVVFGTSAMIIYEDYENVIRCYNCPLGEYYLGVNAKLEVCILARNFKRKVWQVVEEWGLENCTDRVKNAYQMGGNRLSEEVEIFHLIEPNDDRGGKVPSIFAYREFYWEASADDGQVLATRGYFNIPGIFPRWEVTGNDAYGTSPGMDALGDIIQLQHESKRKGQALDYYIRPPTISDISLQGKPTALLPGNNTFVANLGQNPGVKPVYQIQPAIQEITADLRDVQARIRETFYNDLFKMISQLETVRSATEIDARREEKLILLGPVLERFGNEALDKAIDRVYETMDRARLLPKAPASIQNAHIEIQYISILSSAQSAVGVAPTERWLQLVGNLSAVYPPALDIPNFDELLRDYGRDVGVKARGINSRDFVEKTRDAKQAAEAAAASAEVAKTLSEGAKNLSQTEVGGGANALQQILG